MRLWRLTVGDVVFQWKYGFYAVYAIFTAVYLLALAAVPDRARPTVAAVMIFTDPAAMGLFFMGAIVLLEKSQRVHCALAVSPIRIWEYCAAKLLSLALIGLLVALVLALAGGIPNLAACLCGVALTSLICSSCGLIAAARCRTLNRFVLLAVPFTLFLCIPPALLLFSIDHPMMTAHPGVAAVRLICGEAPDAPLCLLSLAVWSALALLPCVRAVRKSLLSEGGGAACARSLP